MNKGTPPDIQNIIDHIEVINPQRLDFNNEDNMVILKTQTGHSEQYPCPVCGDPNFEYHQKFSLNIGIKGELKDGKRAIGKFYVICYKCMVPRYLFADELKKGLLRK